MKPFCQLGKTPDKNKNVWFFYFTKMTDRKATKRGRGRRQGKRGDSVQIVPVNFYPHINTYQTAQETEHIGSHQAESGADSPAKPTKNRYTGQ